MHIFDDSILAQMTTFNVLFYIVTAVELSVLLVVTHAGLSLH